MSLSYRCCREFDGKTRARGSAYAVDGAVNLQVTSSSGVQAAVEGSSWEPYQVVIDWSSARDGVVSADCTCPRFADGHLCKHIWATILTVEAAQAANPVPGRGALEVIPGEPDDPNDSGEESDSLLGGIMNAIISAASGSLLSPTRSHDRRAPRAPATPAWQSALDEVEGDEFTDEIPSPWDQFQRAERRAWYVIDVGNCVEDGVFTVRLQQQERKRDGDFGKVKPLRFQLEMLDEFEDASDRHVLKQLAALSSDIENDDYRYSYRYDAYAIGFSVVELREGLLLHILPQLAATGRLVWMLDSEAPIEEGRPVGWDAGEAWRFELVMSSDDTARQWTLTARFSRDGETMPVADVVMVSRQGFLLLPDTLARLDATSSPNWATWAVRHLPVSIPYADRQKFLQNLWQSSPLPHIVWPDILPFEKVTQPPQPRLRVRTEKPGGGRKNHFYADVAFLYGTWVVEPSDLTAGRVVPSDDENNPIDRVFARDWESEGARLAELGRLPTVVGGGELSSTDQVKFKKLRLSEIVDRLLATGWLVEAEGKLLRSAGEFKIEVESGIDWFDLDATIDFGEEQAKLPDLLAAARRGEKYIELGDGSHGLLPTEWLARYTDLVDLGETLDGKVRFARSQALLLDAMVAEQQNLKVDRTFEQYRERLRSVDGVAAIDPSRSFKGTLREYQRQGLGWFRFLGDLGVGGCLADDMGLGKTIQVLALLDRRRTRRLGHGESRKPSLIVVPKSLVFNWIDEAQRFTPKLRVVNYTGTDRKELVRQFDKNHVIVTTYGTLRRDIVELKDRAFDYAVLDEAQAIKNCSSQASKSCLLLKADHRLALTGTPIENHLGELWSLFEFLNPGMLGRSKAFAALCRSMKRDDRQSLENLSRAIAPFVFRRTKEQVLSELPKKTEQTLFCDLAPAERKAYNELRDFYRAKLSQVIDEKGLKQSKIHVLEALLRLRQAACHQGLIDKNKAKRSSTKLDTLLEQLDEVISEGHKALVFSQFTSLLAIVRDKLDRRGIRYEYLDGKTRDRKRTVDRFQNDQTCPVFLISLKAGGHGLNLTAADYVFILDPWWNPAVEMQAIDRAHRIGQTRRVFAYRIIARNTVEEKVLQLQETKRDLANAIITANDSLIRKLTADDLKLILS